MYSRSSLFETHARLLADRKRVECFERAVAGTVKHGDVVVDLEAGIGLLALMALRAGARKVFAIERGEAGELAQRVFAANGATDRIELIREASWRVILPEQADVVLGDLFHFGFHAAGVRQIIDARTRMLKPGGALLPSRLQLMTAPIQAPHEHEARVGMWTNLYGFDYSSVRPVVAGRVGASTLLRSDLAAEPEVLLDIDLTKDKDWRLRGRAASRLARPATVHGFGFWLRAHLGPGLEISSAPVDRAIGPGQHFVPFGQGLAMGASEDLTIEVSIRDEAAWDWTFTTRSSHGEETRRLVYSASRDDARKGMTEERRSALLRAGRSVLESLQQRARTAREATEDLLLSHGALFPTRRAAEEFVGDLLRRFSQPSPPTT